jgi:hypothetical protein
LGPQHAGKAHINKARAAGDLEFTLAIHDSGEVKRLRYRDVQGLSDPGKTPAAEILENIGPLPAGVVIPPPLTPLFPVLTKATGTAHWIRNAAPVCAPLEKQVT